MIFRTNKIRLLLLCTLVSIVVGLYAAEAFYSSYSRSAYEKPSGPSVSIEQMRSFQAADLAELLYLETENRKLAEIINSEQQLELRTALLVLAAWSLVLLLVLIFVAQSSFADSPEKKDLTRPQS